jgi:hypothetical protein
VEACAQDLPADTERLAGGLSAKQLAAVSGHSGSTRTPEQPRSWSPTTICAVWAYVVPATAAAGVAHSAIEPAASTARRICLGGRKRISLNRRLSVGGLTESAAGVGAGCGRGSVPDVARRATSRFPDLLGGPNLQLPCSARTVGTAAHFLIAIPPCRRRKDEQVRRSRTDMEGAGIDAQSPSSGDGDRRLTHRKTARIHVHVTMHTRLLRFTKGAKRASECAPPVKPGTVIKGCTELDKEELTNRHRQR